MEVYRHNSGQRKSVECRPIGFDTSTGALGIDILLLYLLQILFSLVFPVPPVLTFYTRAPVLHPASIGPIRFMFRFSRLARAIPRQFRHTARQSVRLYSQRAEEPVPKVRYLFYVSFLATGVLWAATTQVKRQDKTFASEAELKAYEERTGLKIRSRLIDGEKSSHYSFYVIPYVHLDESVEKIKLRLGASGRQVKVIDPEELVKQEIEDESRRYSFLLQDLQATNKPYPKGLITALIKEEVQLFLNTRSGTFDTNFLIKNYPQTTDEAIKFENDIADVEKCLVLHYDMLNELENAKGPEATHRMQNVVGYFDTVEKVKTIVARTDEMDDKLKEIVLQDI